MPRVRLLSIAVFSVAALAALARPAAAQTVGGPPIGALLLPTHEYRPYPSLDIDGGGAYNFEAKKFRLVGTASAGVGFFDGEHILDFTAGVRGMLHDEVALVVEASRISVDNGLGMHGKFLWDF